MGFIRRWNGCCFICVRLRGEVLVFRFSFQFSVFGFQFLVFSFWFLVFGFSWFGFGLARVSS